MHRNHKTLNIRLAIAALALGSALTTQAALASGGHSGGHGHGHGPAIGQPAKATEAARTIEIVMADNYYEPERVEVVEGEVVRFIVRNEGALVHEFNIGTADSHHAHQAEMAMMMEHGVIEMDRIHHDRMNMDMGNGHTMNHDDPNSVLLEPGQSAEIVWRFDTHAAIEFACNMPGHYAAGMVGSISVK